MPETPWLDAMQADIQSWAFAMSVLVVALAGVVRGFSGFGAAMIMVPALSVFYGPAVAIPIMILVDAVAAAPLLPPAMRRCRWREVLPILAGSAMLMPVGVYVLLVVEQDVLATAIALIVLALVAILATGWRYRGVPSTATTLATGGLSGFMSGSTGLGGPPVILFWIAGQSKAPALRANVIALFGLNTVVSISVFTINGLFTAEVIRLSLLFIPIYGLALLGGARLFKFASEQAFRTIALTLVAVVAAASLIGVAG